MAQKKQIKFMIMMFFVLFSMINVKTQIIISKEHGSDCKSGQQVHYKVKREEKNKIIGLPNPFAQNKLISVTPVEQKTPANEGLAQPIQTKIDPIPTVGLPNPFAKKPLKLNQIIVVYPHNPHRNCDHYPTVSYQIRNSNLRHG